MAQKYKYYLKSIIKRIWFLILIAVIIILAFYHQIPAALIITTIAIVLLLLTFIPSLFSKRKLLRHLKKHYVIDDESVAKSMKKHSKKIRSSMFELSQKQEKRKWLIIYLDKRYIYYHQDIIKRFKELYDKGYSDKEILEHFKKNEISSISEVKVIKDALIKHERIIENK